MQATSAALALTGNVKKKVAVDPGAFTTETCTRDNKCYPNAPIPLIKNYLYSLTSYTSKMCRKSLWQRKTEVGTDKVNGVLWCQNAFYLSEPVFDPYKQQWKMRHPKLFWLTTLFYLLLVLYSDLMEWITLGVTAFDYVPDYITDILIIITGLFTFGPWALLGCLELGNAMHIELTIWLEIVPIHLIAFILNIINFTLKKRAATGSIDAEWRMSQAEIMQMTGERTSLCRNAVSLEDCKAVAFTGSVLERLKVIDDRAKATTTAGIQANTQQSIVERSRAMLRQQKPTVQPTTVAQPSTAAPINVTFAVAPSATARAYTKRQRYSDFDILDL